MKTLTQANKDYLLSIGYKPCDFKQIQKAISVTTYMDENNTKLSKEQAIDLLGVNTYLSGISRSSFHWSSCRQTTDGKISIFFDSSKLFK